MTDAYLHRFARMGTDVTIRIVGPAAATPDNSELVAAVARAADWFRQVEAACSRFEERSELRQLSARIGTPVSVSPILFQAVQFALQVAEETAGVFDPTIGHRMAARGFNRNYRTGERAQTIPLDATNISYRDVRLDRKQTTITLLRPLVLDLGAVAKGLAIDLAVRELEAFQNFEVNAGGDLYVAGENPAGKPWSVGIRHPRDAQALIHTLAVSHTAVCTSGDYERTGAEADGAHHLMNPRTGASATTIASVTVVASSAMLADALATAAFVLGPIEGLRLLERSGVEGLIVTPALEKFPTPGFPP